MARTRVTVQAELEESKTRPVRRCTMAERARSVSLALATCDAEERSRKPLLVPSIVGLWCRLAPAPVSEMSELPADRRPPDRTDGSRRFAVNPQ